jgi:hypothetical protein
MVALWDTDEDDDAAFERRLDAVVREIGDRGKPARAQASVPTVGSAPPPAGTPAPAPAPARAPVPAPAPARSPATTQQAQQVYPYTPTMPQQSGVAPPVQNGDSQQVNQQQLLDGSMPLFSQATPTGSSSQLSEMFYLQLERDRAERAERERVERERAAERERAERQLERHNAAERERAERSEARLVIASSAGACGCGLGIAAIAAVLLRWNP